MADAFGLKIGIEGEKDFKNALREINQSFKVLGSEMNLVSSQFDKQDQSIEAITSRNRVLNKEIDTQKDKITTLEKALANASTSFGENDKRTQAWTVQLNNAKAELNKLERELVQNNNTLHEQANSTEDSAESMSTAARAASNLADQIDDIGKEMDDSGKKTSLFGDMLKANLLSEAIIGGIKALGSAIMGIGKAFAGAMKDGVEYNAEMESYTTSFTTMLGDQAKAQELVNDLKQEAASTPFGMRDLASATQTLMGFGISAEDAQKHMRELGDISQGNADRFQSLTLAFAQVSSAGKLTGQDLLQMINAGFNPLEEISRTTGKSMAQLKEDMSKGEITAEMLSKALASATSQGGRFYGSMEAQSKTFAGQMSTLEDGVSSLKGQLSEGLTTMLSGTVLPMVNGWLGELSIAFSEGGAQGLIDAFGGILQEAVQFISDQLPMVVDVATKIIMSLIQGLTAALPQITEGALQLVLTLVNGLIDNLPQIVEAALTMIVTLASGLGDALPELIPSVVDAILLIVQTIIDNMDRILDAALKIIMGLAKGLLKALPKLIDALPELISTIVDFITDNLPEIIEMGIVLVIQLAEGLIQAIPQLVEKLPQIVTAVVDGIGKAAVAIFDIGKNIVEGLWEGIKSMAEWLWQKVSDFFGGIVDGVKGVLGIQSPSKVFSQIGTNMGLGLSAGFVETMNDVKRDMEKAIPQDFHIAANVTANNLDALSKQSAGRGIDAGRTINQTVIIQSPTPLSPSEIARQLKNTSRRLALEW